VTIPLPASGNDSSTVPALHPFNPGSHYRTWVPAAYLAEDWPVFETAPVGNHLHGATVSHLYRFYDADRALLYVGVTTSPMKRWSEHRRSEWWRIARFVAIEPVSPAERLQREQQAIEQGRPKYNRMRPFGRTTK
jgi:predicted GIY-YIG superfamily endonuclease